MCFGCEFDGWTINMGFGLAPLTPGSLSSWPTLHQSLLSLSSWGYHSQGAHISPTLSVTLWSVTVCYYLRPVLAIMCSWGADLPAAFTSAFPEKCAVTGKCSYLRNWVKSLDTKCIHLPWKCYPRPLTTCVKTGSWQEVTNIHIKINHKWQEDIFLEHYKSL